MFIPLVFLHQFQVADQQSAMFGQCCFDAGDVNCTMGTGSFVDINTGSYPHASVAGKAEHMPISLWRREAIHLTVGIPVNQKLLSVINPLPGYQSFFECVLL